MVRELHIVGPSSAAVTVCVAAQSRSGSQAPSVLGESALRVSAVVLSWRRHVVGQASHSWWARAAVEVSLESCPLTPSPAPHLCSHRDLDKEGDFVQEFSRQRGSNCAIWLCLKPSVLQWLSSPLGKVLAPWPGIKGLIQSGPWKPLGLLASCSLCLWPEGHSYFLCESCCFLPPTFLPCRTPTQPLSPS